MKLSFTLSSSSSSSKSSSSRPSLTTAALGDGGGGSDDPALKSEFVTLFDPNVTLTTAPALKSEFVTLFDPNVTLTTAPAPSIEPLPNDDGWRLPKRMKHLLPPPSDSDTSAPNGFELDTSQPDSGGVSYGLTLRSKGEGNGAAAKGTDQETTGGGRSEGAVPAEQKFREAMEKTPEDRGFEEFEDIPVEEFSKALLAGYGWKAGQGIGRNAKEDTKVREYKRRAGTGGLGFTPEVAMEKKGAKRGREKLPFPPLPPPVSADVGSTNRSSTASGEKSNVVRIIAGEHAGMKAVVLQGSSRSDGARGTVVLSLLKSRLEVSIGVDMIAELGSAEEEKCLRRLKEVEGREGSERKDKRERDERKDDRRKHRSIRGEEDARGSSRDANHHKGGEHHRSSNDREGNPVSWLRSHIRVRIISKDFKGGRLYLKKGEVMDVVGPTTCDLSMDDSGELLQGVEQKILETALPRRGGPVLVLFGRHKDRFGNLMEKDIEEETAVVRDADNHELIKVRLEQIAEYVGDPSILGY